MFTKVVETIYPMLIQTIGTNRSAGVLQFVKESLTNYVKCDLDVRTVILDAEEKHDDRRANCAHHGMIEQLDCKTPL